MVNEEKRKKKRKMLLTLPAIVIPLLAILAYSYHFAFSGKGMPNVETGFNKTLPEPQLETELQDKMALYKRADEDSFKKRSMEPVENPFGNSSFDSAFSNNEATKKANDPEIIAQNVQEKLAQLQKAISEEPDSTPITLESKSEDTSNKVLNEITRLIPREDQDQDQELKLMKEMLETTLDIQHPQRVRDRMQSNAEKKRTEILPISTIAPESELFSSDHNRAEGNITSIFFELSGAENASSETHKSITAVIHGTQVVSDGAEIKLRLTSDIYISGQLIPSGTFLSGTLSMNGERACISISQVQYHGNIFPVALSVFDYSGVQGILVKGTINRDAMREGSDEMIQAMGLTSLNSSIGGQAASTALQSIKSLLSRKVRQVKITLKADHPVILVTKE